MIHEPIRRGYRPMPRDFPETFARCGWDSIEAEERAHKSTITRWIREYDAAAESEGKPLLWQLRRAWLEKDYAENRGGKRIGGQRPGRARRYVLGRTLTAVIVNGGGE